MRIFSIQLVEGIGRIFDCLSPTCYFHTLARHPGHGEPSMDTNIMEQVNSLYLTRKVSKPHYLVVVAPTEACLHHLMHFQ